MLEEEMTINERRKYLTRMLGRYRQADREGRGELLDEMAIVTGLHRKSLIRLLRPEGLTRKKKLRQRGRIYGHEIDDIVRVVSESLDYICAERLSPALLKTARHLGSHGELVITPNLETLLAKISIPTVQRILSRINQDTPKLPRKGPEQANRLSKEIPMRRIPWDELTPGHFEVDLVHHCGEIAQGDYVHTLQMIDVATGWSERVAILGRSQRAMEEGFRRILERLPFAVLELHPDNGSEFLNHHLVRFWKEKVQLVNLSRSRPYQKNDNRFVEQKNDTLVRAYVGHVRLDSQRECEALDELYEDMWVYYNLFQPVLRLEAKAVEGGKVKRRWDEAKTPLERLEATLAISSDDKERLVELWERTNPRALRRKIYIRLEEVLTLRSEESKAGARAA